MKEDVIAREIRATRAMIIPRFDAIDRQLADLSKQSDSMESGMREFRRRRAFLNLAKEDRDARHD